MGRDQAVAMTVAGIGCRAGSAAEAILLAVREAARRGGSTPTLLAAPSFKAAEPGLRDAAFRLGLELRFVERAALEEAQARCVTRSEAARRATGLASVAEAAALAAAGPGATLLLPRLAQGGVTCALARGFDAQGPHL